MFDHIPNVAGIYSIVNTLNGHRYVGQTINMNRRLRVHVRELDKGTHRTSAERRLQNAWNEFGREAFKMVVLEIVSDNRAMTTYKDCPDNLSLAEHFYINEQSEYNVDKRIVHDKFKSLLDDKAWRPPKSSV